MSIGAPASSRTSGAPVRSIRPLNPARLPATALVLDILEFVAMHLVQPSSQDFHKFFGHYHLFFRSNDVWLDPAAEEFRADVDLIFARNGIAYEFDHWDRLALIGPGHKTGIGKRGS